MALSRQGTLSNISDDWLAQLNLEPLPRQSDTPEAEQTTAAKEPAHDGAGDDSLAQSQASDAYVANVTGDSYALWSRQQNRQSAAADDGFALANDGSTTALLVRQQKQNEENDDAIEAARDMVEASDDRVKKDLQELRDRQWADLMKNDFGINMNTKEWKRADEIMSDETKRKKHFDDLQKKNGWTDKERNEAEKIALEIMRIRQLQLDGKISEDEARNRMGDLKRENPTAFGHALPAVNAAGKNDIIHARSEMKAGSIESRVKQTDDVQVVGIQQNSQGKALPSESPQNVETVSFGRSQFPTAPNATNDFSAVNNSQPSPSEPSPISQPKPMQVAAAIERKFDAVAL